jgi:signal transduction histidine kinase
MNKKHDDLQTIRDQQERIRQQAEHIHALVSALTTMARLDSTYYQNLDAVNLYEMVSSITEEYGDKCQWNMQVTEYNAWIRGHVSDLALAIGNIFSNAVRFAPGKEVDIYLERVADRIRLRVADHGEGMPEEVLARVFERFYRGDDAHSTRGFGLGLSITRRVVELHQGTIEMESVPGSGTMVTLTFPADPERQPSA